MDKKKTKNLNEENYTVSMALFDYLPVIAFFVGCIFVYIHTNSIVFLIGAIISTIAGLSKATWKLIISATKKDRTIMTKIFHILLPSGFLVMIISVFFSLNAFKELIHGLFSMPSLIFTIFGCIGMLCMIIFAITFDSRKAISNWIEQGTNTFAQIFFVIALILLQGR